MLHLALVADDARSRTAVELGYTLGNTECAPPLDGMSALVEGDGAITGGHLNCSLIWRRLGVPAAALGSI